MGGCVHSLPKGRRARCGGRWSQGEGPRAVDHRSCQQHSPQQGDMGPKCPTLSLHTPSDLPSPIAGARIEGRRQNTLGDPAPKSSPGVCLYIECIPEWPTGEFPKGRGAGSLDLDSEGSPWGQIQVELVMGSGLFLPHP